jgi:hypothetical protein
MQDNGIFSDPPDEIFDGSDVDVTWPSRAGETILDNPRDRRMLAALFRAQAGNIVILINLSKTKTTQYFEINRINHSKKLFVFDTSFARTQRC